MNVERFDVEADFFAHAALGVFENLQFVAVGVNQNFVVVALKHAVGYYGRDHAFGYVALYDVDILRTNDDVDRFVRLEAFVHALEVVADKGAQLVLFHDAGQNVAFADEVGDECVGRFVVDFCGVPIC